MNDAQRPVCLSADTYHLVHMVLDLASVSVERLARDVIPTLRPLLPLELHATIIDGTEEDPSTCQILADIAAQCVRVRGILITETDRTPVGID